MVSINRYFDTSCLLKLYIEENGSQESVAHAQGQPALPLSFICEIELLNSIWALHGRELNVTYIELTKTK